MRIDIQITGTPEERADVEARSSQFCAEHSDARVRARIVETVEDRPPEIGLAGQLRCEDCGVWYYPSRTRHQCLEHGGA